jgi:hypothetical protein
VALFRRRRPLHEQLARDGGLSTGVPHPDGDGAPPGWDHLSPVTHPAMHGVPRPRRWEAVVTAEAPAVRGDTVHFVALDDRTLVVDEDEPDDALEPLADAVEQALPPPYRAEAVRRDGGGWTVGASRIRLVEQRGLHGDEVELTSVGGVHDLTVDGKHTLATAPAFTRAGEAEGRDYVVRARRVDGDLWDVEATPL